MAINTDRVITLVTTDALALLQLTEKHGKAAKLKRLVPFVLNSESNCFSVREINYTPAINTFTLKAGANLINRDKYLKESTYEHVDVRW